MTTTRTIRLLQDPPLDGPANMARDEALLAGVEAGESPPTLRLYEWTPPTVSLGYFQPYADYEALEPPAGDLAVVRRTTGGGAILHDLELTYSLALPTTHALLSQGSNHMYELAHDAIIASLNALGIPSARDGESDTSGTARGPFFCFDRRHCFDVLVDGQKIAGSAQRRRRLGVLQHGSIILGNRYTQQTTASVSVGRALPDKHLADSSFVGRIDPSHPSRPPEADVGADHGVRGFPQYKRSAEISSG